MKGCYARGWKHAPKDTRSVWLRRGSGPQDPRPREGAGRAGPGLGWAQPGDPREGKALLCGRAKWGRVQTLGQSRAGQSRAEPMGTKALGGHSLRRWHCSPGISKRPSEKERTELGWGSAMVLRAVPLSPWTPAILPTLVPVQGVSVTGSEWKGVSTGI